MAQKRNASEVDAVSIISRKRTTYHYLLVAARLRARKYNQLVASRKRFAEHYQLIAPRLRDVLPLIFGDLSALSLFRAMLVCRDWAAAAVDLLWRRVPVSAFDDIAPDRRQHYADRVRGLAEHRRVFYASRKSTGRTSRYPRQKSRRLSESEESRDSYDALSFPRLRVLSLEYSARHWGSVQLLPFPAGYIVPTLQRLECSIEELSSGVLQARLAEVRPRLRQLLVRSKSSRDISCVPTSRLPTTRLPELQHFGSGSLEEIELIGRMEIPSPVLAELASRTTLRRFMVDRDDVSLAGAVVEEAFAQQQQQQQQQQRAGVGEAREPRFGALEWLALKSDWHAIERLAETGLPSIRQLVLSIYDRSDRICLAALAPLRRVRRLCLTIIDSATITCNDLRSAVQHMSELRELSLTDDNRLTLQFSGFNETSFASLVAAVPQLEVLRLNGDCNVFPAAVRIAGEHCRQLHELALYLPIVFDSLAHPSSVETHEQYPLFPQLRRLSLNIPSHRERYDNWTKTYYDDEK
jgi:hypothetical protein